MRNFTCPWCGVPASSSDPRFIAASPSLQGDPVLGPDHQLRFRPTRFDAGGCPIDPEGTLSPIPACQSCRHEWPAAIWSSKSAGLLQITGGVATDVAARLCSMGGQRLRALDYQLTEVSDGGLHEPVADSAECPRIAALTITSPGGSHSTVFIAAGETPGPPDVVLAAEDSGICSTQSTATLVRLVPGTDLPPNLISSNGQVLLDRCE